MEKVTVAVVGNPNCGKTTLFNVLTGARQRVGNWPGVTVDRKTGRFRHRDREVELVDLPGIYSLDLAHGESSLDEEIARDYLLSGEPRLVINIVDGANLERNLYLTAQLLEMGIPMLVAVNMMDKAADRGIDIDLGALEAALGCPVVGLTAARSRGVDALKDRLLALAAEPRAPGARPAYGPVLEAALAALAGRVAMRAAAEGVPARWLALKLLEEERLALAPADAETRRQAAELAARVEAEAGDELDILVADARYGFVHALVGDAVRRRGEAGRTLSDRIDRVVLNRVLGIPIFLAVMYLMFMFTINIGGAFIDLFDQLFGALLVDGVGELLQSAGAPAWLVTLLADGLGGGIQVVATFIPIIGFLFLFLSLLEDSGYMARAAFVMDRLMRAIGLPGKSFVPLIVGFGCNVPAIMATRTLENPRDRLLTVLMAPFMSCGARLPVYALFAAAFFPVGGQNLVFGLYLIGIGAAVLTGLIMKKTLLQGDAAPFVMELPSYHRPTLQGMVLRTGERLKSFVFKAGKVIVPMVMILSMLNAMGRDGSFGNQDTADSLLADIGRGLTPIFEPMGIDEENWPATVGIFTGVLAKEAVVGTLDALYGGLAADAAPDEAPAAFDLGEAVAAAFATVPANLADAIGAAGDPLGIDIGEVSDTERAAAEQGVANGTFGAMVARFDGAAGAFAYLLFILLYFPCAAATAAIYREVGARWTLFVVSWTTGLAYGAGVLAYQFGTFARHPAAAGGWIGAVLLAAALALLVLRRFGRRASQQAVLAASPG